MAEEKKFDVKVNELTFEVTDRVKGYLKRLSELGGSDLHVKSNAPTKARVGGEIITIDETIFDKRDGITLAKEMLRTRFGEFASDKEADFVFIYDENLRFRVNMFFQMDGVSAVFRAIPTLKKTIDELNLPPALHKVINSHRGLVLVTGVTGSGKSTTLASMIHQINTSMRKHIITIEDPIEFIHKDINSIINQRSVGQDTNSFNNALKSALREDPDIILVGEMRDIETIEMALHAAETGHLVFSTLHTLDAKETINRIVSVFPHQEQNRIRYTLSSVIQAIISQRLVKTIDGGRVAAVELMLKTPRIEALIKENRDSEIFGAMAEGKSIYNTQTFDQALLDHVKAGTITEEEALNNATSPSDLKLKLSNEYFASTADKDPEEAGVIKLKI